MLSVLLHMRGTVGAVLLEGGDTDTNACIVGGMIGAAVGLGNIPEKMKGPMLSFKPTKGMLNLCDTRGRKARNHEAGLPGPGGLWDDGKA